MLFPPRRTSAALARAATGCAALLLAAFLPFPALGVAAYPAARDLPRGPRVVNHGDERFSYLTDEDGYLLYRDAAGGARRVLRAGDGYALEEDEGEKAAVFGVDGADAAVFAADGAFGAPVLAQSFWEQDATGATGADALAAALAGLSARESARTRARAASPALITPDYDYRNDPLQNKLETVVSGAIDVPARGASVPLLVIRLSFADTPCLFDEAQWQARAFGDGGVTAYYAQNAGAAVFSPAKEICGATDDGVVSVTLPIARPLYALRDGANQNALAGARTGVYRAENAAYAVYNDSSLCAYALEAADPYVDYARYDLNGDRYLAPTELAVLVVAGGYEAGYVGAGAGLPMVWAHQWTLNNQMRGTPPLFGQTAELAVRLDGVGLYAYAMVGENFNDGYVYAQETHDEPPIQATMGVMCHELGHMLGLMDLYDTTGGPQTQSVDALSLMASGSWGRYGGGIPGSSPAHIDPYGKLFLGFCDARDASSPGAYPVWQAADGALYDVLRVPTSDPDIYYLVENRRFAGFDRGLMRGYGDEAPGGAVYWRVDEGLVRALWPLNRLNTLYDDYAIMPAFLPDGTAFRGARADAAHPLFAVASLPPVSLRCPDAPAPRMTVYVLSPAPPATGDRARPLPWALGALAALAGFVIFSRSRAKRLHFRHGGDII